jgi:hypothetical protein
MSLSSISRNSTQSRYCCAPARSSARGSAFDHMTQDLFIWVRTLLPHKFPARVGNKAYPEVVKILEPIIERRLNNIDIRIGDKRFLTNSTRPMICDCHLYALVTGAGKFGWQIPEQFRRLQGWYQRLSERPSANA